MSSGAGNTWADIIISPAGDTNVPGDGVMPEREARTKNVEMGTMFCGVARLI